MPDDSNSPNTHVGAMAPDASTSPVDWSRPIEAVHKDGRVVAVRFVQRRTDRAGDKQPCEIEASLGDGAGLFAEDGSHPWSEWRIRNATPIPFRDLLLSMARSVERRRLAA